jgi:DNA invertase Pin-like site-specific DNA recombinase
MELRNLKPRAHANLGLTEGDPEIGRSGMPKLSDRRMYGYLRHIEVAEWRGQCLLTLRKAGCRVDRVFIEQPSTHRSKRRPELDNLIRASSPGDVVVFISIFEAVAGFWETLVFIEWAHSVDVDLLFVEMGCDTRKRGGWKIVLAMARYLRNRLDENSVSTRRGLERARRAGRTGGRPAILRAEELAQARQMIASGSTMADIAKSLGVSRATLYNAGLSAVKKRAAQKAAPKKMRDGQ